MKHQSTTNTDFNSLLNADKTHHFQFYYNKTWNAFFWVSLIIFTMMKTGVKIQWTWSPTKNSRLVSACLSTRLVFFLKSFTQYIKYRVESGIRTISSRSTLRIVMHVMRLEQGTLLPDKYRPLLVWKLCTIQWRRSHFFPRSG